MKVQTVVRISENSGLPCVWLPEHVIWDFVEFMDIWHGNVVYGYCYSGDGFTLNFHRMDVPSVQQLFSHWIAVRGCSSESIAPTFHEVHEFLSVAVA